MSPRQLALPPAHYRRQLKSLSVPRRRKCVKHRQSDSTAYLSHSYLPPAHSSGDICRVPFHNDKNRWADAQDGYLQKERINIKRALFKTPISLLLRDGSLNSMAGESICSLGHVCGSIAFCVIWSLLYISGGQCRHRNKVMRDLIDSFSVCGGETITHLGMAGILNRWALNIRKESPIGFKAVPDPSPRVRWLIAFLVSAAPGIYAFSDIGEVRVHLVPGHRTAV